MSKFSIKVIFFTISLIGILSIPYLGYKLVPDTVYPSLSVKIGWPNTTQETIESEVTSKLEGMFYTIPNIRKIYSRTYNNYAELFLNYDKNVDIDKERFIVSKIIRQVYSILPENVIYPTISSQRHDNNDITLVSYSITSDLDYINLLNFIDNTLLPKINSIKGVKDVQFQGISDNHYQVTFDIDKVLNLGIALQEIKDRLEETLRLEYIGKVYDKNEELDIIINDIKGIEELREIPIYNNNGRIIKLSDIATVINVFDNRVGTFRINGNNAISFFVTADATENQIILANEIKGIISNIERDYKSIELHLLSDSSSFIKKELIDAGYRSLLSLIILIVLSIFTYRNINYLKYLFLALFTTILMSILVFNLLNIDIHIYSLMAIAISIGFVIDNSIIVIDHFLKKNDHSIILVLVAATITTTIPLLLIILLKNENQIDLIDFSKSFVIVLVNSLLVSYFLVPALIDRKKMQLSITNINKIKFLIKQNNFYSEVICFLKKRRTSLFLIIALLFGFPIFLLPDNIEGDHAVVRLYNSTLGSDKYKEDIKINVDKYLGGTLRLIVESSSDGNEVEVPKRLRLIVRIFAPFGSTKEYLNEICSILEDRLSLNLDNGVDYFQTEIHDERNGEISVFIDKGLETTNLPYRIKGFLEKQVISIGGADFLVSGVGRPFGTGIANTVDSNIIIKGYDYIQLHNYALEISKYLENNTRIDKVILAPEPSWLFNEHSKYVVNSNLDTYQHIYNKYKESNVGYIKDKGNKKVSVNASFGGKDNSFYSFLNDRIEQNKNYSRLKYDVDVALKETPDYIAKEAQEFQLVLQYSFNGTPKHNKLVREEVITYYKKKLAPGFSIFDNEKWTFLDDSYYLVFTIIVSLFLIFSILSILLESFKQSLAIIFMIPVTLIGVFYFLDKMEVSFSQGVYSGLLLLVGLLINSAIFITAEYNSINKNITPVKAYIKAVNNKIIPIILTIITTISGLAPYLILSKKNTFWFPFATTISIGLIFSFLAVIFILPAYIIKKND